MPIRVVLGEDNYLLREGIGQLLATQDRIEVVGTGEDLAGVQRAIADMHLDVVVTDIRMPPTGTDEGLRIAQRFGEERPEVGVVVLSQHAEPEYALALLEKGAAGRGRRRSGSASRRAR
jgi:DNA-binding NarL/FixJ family response regulator